MVSDFVLDAETSEARWIRDVTELVSFGGRATLSGAEPQEVGLTATNRELALDESGEFHPSSTPSLRLSRVQGYDGGLWRKLGRYQFDHVGPGTYTISAAHPRMSFTSVSITVPSWPTPGDQPVVDPTEIENFNSTERQFAWPGLLYRADETVVAAYFGATTLRRNCNIWRLDNPDTFDVDESRYEAGGCTGRYIEMSISDGLWIDNGTTTPGRFKMWVLQSPGQELRDDGLIARWMVWEGSASGGEIERDFYTGGPQDSGGSEVPGSGPFRLTTKAVHLADRATEIPSVAVVVGGGSMTTGATITHAGHLTVDSVVSPGWGIFDSSVTTIDLLSVSPLAYLLTIPLERAMTIEGTVRDDKSEPLPGATINVFSRYGDLLKSIKTDDAAAYRIAVPAARAGIVEVAVPGFVPDRQRFEPGAAEAEGPFVVSMGETTLKRLNPPRLSDFTLDRFGLFLPGVLKSGDSNDYSTQTARDTLTLTWQAKVQNLEETYPITGFDLPDGQHSETVFRDRIDEVWLLDRRWFSTPPINSADGLLSASGGQISLVCASREGGVCAVDHNDAMDLLEAVRASQKDFAPYHVVWDRISGGDGDDQGIFSGTLNLWDLPSGEFSPMVVAVTAGGAVSVLNYTLPPDGIVDGRENPLRGVGLPPWAASILDGIGVAATYAPDIKQGVLMAIPEGWFVPLPAFEAEIKFTPADAAHAELADEERLRSPGYLTYVYKIAGNWEEGVAGPGSGPLASGPSFLGVIFEGNPTAPVTGASVEIKVDGKASTVGVTGSAKLSATLLDGKESGWEDFAPSFLGDQVSVSDVKVNGEVSLGLAEFLDSDWQGKNRVSELRLIVKAGGDVSATWSIDASDQVARISGFIPPPPVGAFVGTTLAVAAKGEVLRFFVDVGTSVGGSRERTFCTKLPSPAGEEPPPPPPTQTVTSVERVEMPSEEERGLPASVQPAAYGFLGLGGCPNPPDPVNKIRVGFTVGMRAVVGDDALSLSGSIGVPSLEFTLNKEASWPPVTRVQGDIVGSVKFTADLWVDEYSHEWKWEVYRIDWQLGTEPYFLLTPLNISNVVVTPAAASPASFNPGDLRLIKDFYPAGSLDGTLSASGTVLEAITFTGIDPDSGEMTLEVSVMGADGWRQPVQVASAPGIIGAAVGPNPSGGLIVVWSEFSAEEVTNRFPSSTVKYSASDLQGEVWAESIVIAREANAAHELKLVRAGGQALLVYLTTDDGPGSHQRALSWTVWNGSDWSTPEQLLPTQAIASVSMAGSAGDAQRNAVVAVTDGNGLITMFVWESVAWQPQEIPVTDSDLGLSVSIDPAGRVVMVWEKRGGGIAVSAVSPSGIFSDLVSAIPAVSAEELAAVPVQTGDQPGHLIAWTQGANLNSVFYALVGDDGTALQPPIEATPGSSGVYSDLRIQRLIA